MWSCCSQPASEREVTPLGLSLTPIRPPGVKSAEVSPDALLVQRDERVSIGSSGTLTSIQGAGAEPVGLCTKHLLRFVPAGEPEQERAPATLEDHACPHAVRFKGSTGWKAEAMASYLRARVRGRASISEDPSVHVDRSERRCPIKQGGYQENIGYPARVRRRAHRLPSGSVSS